MYEHLVSLTILVCCKSWWARGWSSGTPSQDYDDSYCITYAKRHDGYVISNDMYRCVVEAIEYYPVIK